MFGMDPEDSILQVDLAYELGPDWWNRGLMTEAVQAVLSFFLRQVGFNMVCYSMLASDYKNKAAD